MKKITILLLSVLAAFQMSFAQTEYRMDTVCQNTSIAGNTGNNMRDMAYHGGQMVMLDKGNSKLSVHNAMTGALVLDPAVTTGTGFSVFCTEQGVPVYSVGAYGMTARLELFAFDGTNSVQVANSGANNSIANAGRFDYVSSYGPVETTGGYVASATVSVVDALAVWDAAAGVVTNASTPRLFTGLRGNFATASDVLFDGANKVWMTGQNTKPVLATLDYTANTGTSEVLNMTGTAPAGGMARFDLGAKQYVVVPTSTLGAFAIYDITAGLTTPELVYTQSNDLGTTANAALHVGLAASVSNDTAYIYSFVPNNGLITYRFWDATPKTLVFEEVLDTVVIYTTGFDAGEGFAAATTYNQPLKAYGPTNYQWGMYYGCPSTNSSIAGGQSFQMRWYTSATSNLGYGVTDFYVDSIAEVTFSAKITNNMRVTVQYSVDSGVTFVGDSVFALTTAARNYTYNMPQTDLKGVKIKFLTTLPSGNAPTSTSSVIIDEVEFLKFATINRVSTPVITPESGNISDSTEVTITCATEGASIYYTTDGSLPTSASTLYSAPFYIPAASATVQAIAIMEDVMDSEVARAEYVYVAANQVVAPVITPEGGTFTGDVYVKITCATEGARIYYTLDGTTPDTTSSTLYTDSIMLLNTTTVKAIAAKTDMENSEVATETYTLPVTINVDDIAGFYSVSAAAPTDSIDYYRITDAVTAVYQQGQNLYIHDASGWLLIYGAQDSTFVNGDLLQGVKGKHGLYQGCAQMTYAILPEATQGVAVAPVEKLIGGLAIADNYMYVKLTGVSFTTAANYTTGSTTNGTVSDGSNTITIRNNFRVINASYAIGDRVDIEGFVSVYNNAVQIYPISITDNPLTVETPVISPDGGDIAVATQVSITCATEDAIIYYTIDGTTPTTASAVYSAPFSVSETTTVSAMATKTSMTASAVATQTYTWVGIDTVATPVITPESGNILSGAAVTITCATPGATIYYTLDGTTPSETSATYTAPLTIVYNTTVKAYAVNAGMADSEMAEATYTIVSSLVDEPVISPVGGNVTDTVTVTITCATAGAKIYYTIDGTTPDTLTATEYTAAFTVGETTTVKAIAAKAGMTTSNVVTETYTFPVPVVEEPVISPVGGNVTAPVTVTITCATAGAKIYYTTDGTAPDTLTATEYTAAFTVSATATVKAIAAKAGMTTSAVVEETYTFPMEVVETPVITPAGGNVTAATQVTITCATADAKIYYTIDGTTPDTLSSTLYTGAITVSVTTTVKAIAAKAGMTTSDIATETYTFPATTEVTDIAAFYAAGAAGTSGAKYTITGAVNVVYQNYMSLYVQDASGWLLIYGSFNGDSYTNGQLLEGVQGEYTTYQGYGQMINFTLPDATQGATVSPVIKQVADIVNDDVYMYVQLSGVYFTENVTFNTSSTTSGTVQQNGSQIGIRNNFRVIDATFTPAEELMIEGFVSVFSGTAQIYPTAISALSSVNTVELQPIYVSQGAIYVPANVGDQIEVYTVTGQCLVILKAEQALTVINDMPKDQILMVRVANKTSKVVVR